MNRIQKVSKFFRWLFQVTFIATPILLIFSWIYAPLPVPEFAANFGFSNLYIPDDIKILSPLPSTTKVLGFFISLIPVTINAFVLYFLIKLFSLFEACKIFSLETARYIRNIGYTLFIGQLLNPIYQALISPVLTWHNPHGERIVSISFSQTNIGVLLMALLIMLISWIMVEGYKLQEDQKYTI